jgi:hypothetical protein
MNETAFRNMAAHQAAMGLGKNMLHQGINFAKEYDKIGTIMTKKHSIHLGIIFRNNA